MQLLEDGFWIKIPGKVFIFAAVFWIFFSCTKEIPKVTTHNVSNVQTTSAVSGGKVTDDGNADVTARGVCWSTVYNPTVNDTKTLDGSGIGSFTSDITQLTPGISYYIRAYATNSEGTGYGEQVDFTTNSPVLATVTTLPVSSITSNSAESGGNVTDDGGSEVTARGVCWNTLQNPSPSNFKTTDGGGIGHFTSSITGLQPNTIYYYRAYATSIVGTAYGEELNFSTAPFIPHVTNPATGKIWMDRNLGASRVATSSTDEDSYGDLYQWGRAADGHQIRTSGTTTTLSSSDTPGHGNFILVFTSPYDWRSPQNTNLWQGVSGVNYPCPVGYRLPTAAEWDAERMSWSTNNAAGAFASPLKLPVAGYRSPNDGSLSSVGSYGYYWSSTVSSTNSGDLMFSSSNAIVGNNSHAHGYSVRCLKD
jgi:uncharacterized protein (TIGR02145 family)